jgi:hypothetical protein
VSSLRFPPASLKNSWKKASSNSTTSPAAGFTLLRQEIHIVDFLVALKYTTPHSTQLESPIV